MDVSDAHLRRLISLFLFALLAGFPTLVSAEIDVTSGDEYDVWTISGLEVYDLEDGEDLSNILVDQTEDGATLTIRSRNKSDWTVKDVGFVGVGTDGDGSNSFQFQVSTPSGGTGLIENVWMNNKTRDDQQADTLGGIYIRSSHAGHVDIRHTWIEGFGNNAVYGSAVGKDGGSEGSVALENCYHRDNTVSQFRIGSPGSAVRNCVAVVDDPQGLRGSYPSSDSKNARGIWGKHFRGQRVENSAFYISPEDTNPDGAFEARYIPDRSRGPEAVLEVVDCDVNSDAPILEDTTENASVEITNLGNSPSVSVIGGGGVPTSAKMAARGNRETPPRLPGEEGGGDSETTETLLFEAAGDQRAEYEFTVDEALREDADSGALEAEDSISGASAEGVVEDDSDGFGYSGSITEFRLVSEATVIRNGESVDPATLGEYYPHTLQIDGTDVGRTDYEFTVDGDLTDYDYLGGIGIGDSITGSTAQGFVNGGTDGFAYSGSIKDFELDGEATVYVDGQSWDPDDCCETPDAGSSADASGTIDDRDVSGSERGSDSDSLADAGEGERSANEEGSGCRQVPSAPPPFWAMIVLLVVVRIESVRRR